MGMKGIDKQHVSEDTDDALSIFTDVAGSIDLGEKHAAKYWPSLSEFNPHDFAFELEGDCVNPSAAEEATDEYMPVPNLPPNFLQSAMAQLAFTRSEGEHELHYLGRIRKILKRMTLDEFELLVEEVDPGWEPKGSLWREFGQFQFQAGMMIGKREKATEILDRLKLEQGLHHKEAVVGAPPSIHDILVDGLDDIPDTRSSSSSTEVHTGEETTNVSGESTEATDEEETREKTPRASSYGRIEAKDYLKSQKTIVFSVLRTGSHAQAKRTPPMRTWDYQMPFSFQNHEDSDQERSDMSVFEDEEDMKMASMLGHMF
ncbi:hypothetical protein PG993_006418 [Apiospora rasikravindrae]|uniref:Uncharacterized protein n=1 Tax=Apiospora rasikravindrae TaxID=990691 RepID=A0ABR1T5M3_9PEZI